MKKFIKINNTMHYIYFVIKNTIHKMSNGQPIKNSYIICIFTH